MAVLEITKGVDNKILRAKSAKVKKIDRKIKKLIADMIETMEHMDGLGIAAPQVGINLHIYIARLNFSTPNEMIVPMINAEFLEKSDRLERHEEGCLSIPGKFGVVERPSAVTIRYMDEKELWHTLKLEDLNARIMQHEMDHLDGTLIADKWSEAANTKRADR